MNEITILEPASLVDVKTTETSTTRTSGLAQVKAALKAKGFTGKLLKIEVDKAMRTYHTAASGYHATAIAEGGQLIRTIERTNSKTGVKRITTVLEIQPESEADRLRRVNARLQELIDASLERDLTAEEKAEIAKLRS